MVYVYKEKNLNLLPRSTITKCQFTRACRLPERRHYPFDIIIWMEHFHLVNEFCVCTLNMGGETDGRTDIHIWILHYFWEIYMTSFYGIKQNLTLHLNVKNKQCVERIRILSVKKFTLDCNFNLMKFQLIFKLIFL